MEIGPSFFVRVSEMNIMNEKNEILNEDRMKFLTCNVAKKCACENS